MDHGLLRVFKRRSFVVRYRHLQASVLLVVIAEKPKDHAAETKQVYHWMN